MIRFPSSKAEIVLFFLVSIYLFEIYKFGWFWFEFFFNWKKSNEFKFRLYDFQKSVYFFFIIECLGILLLLTNLFLGINKASLCVGLFSSACYHLVTLSNLDEIEGDINRETHIRRKQFVKKRIINFWIILALSIIQFNLI